MVALALPVIHRDRLLSMRLPNSWNFGFDYAVACVLIVIGYLPGTKLDATATTAHSLEQAFHSSICT